MLTLVFAIAFLACVTGCLVAFGISLVFNEGEGRGMQVAEILLVSGGVFAGLTLASGVFVGLPF
jgi:hypothetical protein